MISNTQVQLAEPEKDLADDSRHNHNGDEEDALEGTSETTRLKSSSVQDDTITKEPVTRKPTVQIQEPAVSDMRGYEVVKIVEKHGVFHSAIPVMPVPLAVIFCLLNMVLPGTGTLLCSPLCCCCPTRHASKVRAFFFNLLAAFLQMLTFLVIVGWIWSIQWGIIMIQLAMAPKRNDNGALPYYVRRQSSIEHSSTSKA